LKEVLLAPLFGPPGRVAISVSTAVFHAPDDVGASIRQETVSQRRSHRGPDGVVGDDALVRPSNRGVQHLSKCSPARMMSKLVGGISPISWGLMLAMGADQRDVGRLTARAASGVVVPGKGAAGFVAAPASLVVWHRYLVTELIPHGWRVRKGSSLCALLRRLRGARLGLSPDRRPRW